MRLFSWAWDTSLIFFFSYSHLPVIIMMWFLMYWQYSISFVTTISLFIKLLMNICLKFLLVRQCRHKPLITELVRQRQKFRWVWSKGQVPVEPGIHNEILSLKNLTIINRASINMAEQVFLHKEEPSLDVYRCPLSY